MSGIARQRFEDGYCFVYIDVKQAEPRTILSAVHSDLVNEEDIYLKLANNDIVSREKIKKNFLASLYSGKLTNAFPPEYSEDLNKILAFEKDLADYAERTGFLKTRLGEVIPTTKEKALNSYAQGLTAVLLAAFFQNVVNKGRSLGFDIAPVFFQHDAIVYQMPIKWLLHVDLLIRKYFRAACKKYFDIDYPYKLKLYINNWLEEVEYKFTLNKLALSLVFHNNEADYCLQNLAQNYTFNIIKKEDQGNDIRYSINLTECLPNIDWWFYKFEDKVEDHLKAETWK